MGKTHATRQSNFYPRPPRGGRHKQTAENLHRIHISIHALREEGDSYFLAQAGLSKIFLSTPSARRATGNGPTS